MILKQTHDFNCGFPLIVLKTDSFVLGLNTKDIIRDLRNSEDFCDFSNLDEKHELFINKNKKVIGKFKNDTPKNIWIDEVVCVRNKIHSFKRGDDIKIKIEKFSKSQSKHVKFEEYKNHLDGEEYQKDSDNYIVRSFSHEMYFQNVRKLALSSFDNKRCYINETESKHWN